MDLYAAFKLANYADIKIAYKHYVAFTTNNAHRIFDQVNEDGTHIPCPPI